MMAMPAITHNNIMIIRIHVIGEPVCVAHTTVCVLMRFAVPSTYFGPSAASKISGSE